MAMNCIAINRNRIQHLKGHLPRVIVSRGDDAASRHRFLPHFSSGKRPQKVASTVTCTIMGLPNMTEDHSSLTRKVVKSGYFKRAFIS
jgi:hypothetical protein